VTVTPEANAILCTSPIFPINCIQAILDFNTTLEDIVKLQLADRSSSSCKLQGPFPCAKTGFFPKTTPLRSIARKILQ